MGRETGEPGWGEAGPRRGRRSGELQVSTVGLALFPAATPLTVVGRISPSITCNMRISSCAEATSSGCTPRPATPHFISHIFEFQERGFKFVSMAAAGEQELASSSASSGSDTVSLLSEESDEENDEFGTPEGDFVRRISAPAPGLLEAEAYGGAARDDCIYGWVVRT
jgi:hypothetical protein